MNDNKDFYPTPFPLITKMWFKADHSKISRVLEPSAGAGNIADFVKETGRTGYGRYGYSVSCIERDPRLSAMLRGKEHKVIDSDFLAYSGTDRFDLIIMNPPFSDGDSHLLKAIDITYCGQIVCLLNAETLRNPHSNQRKVLVQRLEELGATIEFLTGAFEGAERKTSVEVALVYIDIKRDVETDFFGGCSEAEKINVKIDAEKDLVSGNSITSRVELFNDSLKAGLAVIETYFRNFPKVSGFIRIESGEREKYPSDPEAFADKVNEKINTFAETLRKHYWKSILDLDEVRRKMTQKKIEEFNQIIDQYSYMDFTESNVRQFILGIIGDYEETLTEAVIEVFDLMTTKHSWNKETERNIHYYNGWATNKAFFCNKKVVLPVYGSCGNPFIGWNGEWRLNDYDVERKLGDIDKVMNYFDAGSEYISICQAITKAFQSGQSRGIESTYFKIDVFKKRTVHLTFRSEDIRRRFNVTACKGKKWLPQDYGKKKYSDMTAREKETVESFEGRHAYEKTAGEIGFAKKSMGMIA